MLILDLLLRLLEHLSSKREKSLLDPGGAFLESFDEKKNVCVIPFLLANYGLTLIISQYYSRQSGGHSQWREKTMTTPSMSYVIKNTIGWQRHYGSR